MTEITKDNYKSEYNEFFRLYNEAQETLSTTGVTDNEKYVKCLEYSFRLTEYFNPIHPLKYGNNHELIKNLYFIRSDLLVRTVGLNTGVGIVNDHEKLVFHTVVALLRKCSSIDPFYLPAMELFKTVVIYMTISNPNASENIQNLKQALYVYPSDFQLQYNLGFAYHRNNDLENSVAHFKLCVGLTELQLDNETAKMFRIKALNGIGGVYYSVQDRYLAEYFFKKALVETPNDPDINNQLGVIHTELRNTDIAIAYYKHGIINYQKSHISPDKEMLIASMYMNMGLAMCYQCDFVSAIDSYNQALKHKPSLHLAYQNKLLDLNYISHLIKDKMYIAKLHKNLTKFFPKDISDYKESLPDYKPKHTVMHCTQKLKIIDNEKIRVGFVSGDYVCHPVSYFISSILSGINFNIFDIVCYSSKLTNSSGQFPKCTWITTRGMSAETLAETIKGHKIDILFDLSAHTGDNRLDMFVLKPAPIQISYCGYPGSSGIKAIDYHLTDKICDSEKSEKYYREKLIYLDKCFLNYTPSIGTDLVPLPSETPYQKNGYITFGCFNRFNKINDMVIRCWQDLLQNIPTARLVVKTKEFSTEKMKEKFINAFTDKSVLERIQILDYSDTYIEHLPDYNLMDVSLDTFPYSGTTTSCESLFMGVPVLTLFDNVKYYHSQNVTSSLLTWSDMKEYITYSQTEYIHKAKELSENFGGTTKEFIRCKFLQGDVCNSKEFVDSFENTLVDVYKKHKW